MIDIVTIVGMLVAFALAALLAYLLQHGKVRLSSLPLVLGFGGGLYSLIGALTAGFMILPASKLPAYIVFSCVLSLCIGIIGYSGGRWIAARRRK